MAVSGFWEFAGLVLVGVVLNAAVCGMLSGPEDRYQARVVWLVPLLALIASSTNPSSESLRQRAVQIEGGSGDARKVRKRRRSRQDQRAHPTDGLQDKDDPAVAEAALATWGMYQRRTRVLTKSMGHI